MLEVVAYGIGGCMWWIASASILFPFIFMLKISKTFRGKWFSFFFTKLLGPLFGPMARPYRKKVFDQLKDELRKEKKSTHSYEVLEIGMGAGANLEYYPENCVLTALDMNPSFESYFNDSKKKYPQITFKRMIHGMAENMAEVSNDSVDILICTSVLCSVEDVKCVLSEVKRVLKPGGKFVFLEHVAFHVDKDITNYTLQKIAAPLWKIYFDGCNVDRDIGKDIKNAGFAYHNMEEIQPENFVLYVRPTLYGIATK